MITTTYIKIPVDKLEDFSAAYYAETGENIQSNPPINEEGTHYLVGSTRIKTTQKLKLKLLHISVAMGAYPKVWEPKIEPLN